MLATRKLSAVFIERHGGGVGDVVGVRQSPDGDFDDVIDEGKFFVSEAKAFVADDEGGAAREAEVVETGGVGGLFEADEDVALGFEFFQDGWQSAVRLDGDLVGTVAGDRLVDFRIAAGNEAGETTAAGSADDIGEIDVATHRCAAQN
jgi:hypothetical protein